MELLSEEGLVESTALERSEQFIASIGDYPDTYHGRGIVVCGGGLTYFTNAWVCISLLRHVGCRLPVQLWYLGRGEVDERMEELVAPLGVECVDATAVRTFYPARILRGWEVKPYAILHSPFREVLLLDADNCVAANPEALFETWEYRDTGALFWPDLGRLHPDHSSWRIFGVPFRDEPEIESGQIVVNKETCWKALSLTKYYNDYSDFYYRYVHGDKETFHFAFRKVGQAYAMPSRPTRFEHGTFFQADFTGKTIFQHRNGAKWNFEGDNPFIREFHYEAECHRFLEELRVVWDGQIGRPRFQPAREDLDAVRSELTTRIYRFARDGSHRAMSFASDGRVGLGATDAECNWKVYDSDRGVALEIGARGSASCVLLRNAQGWKSASGSVRLVPIPRKVGASRRPPLSLTEFVEKMELYAGVFAWHQYAMARDLQSDVAIVIGPIDSAAALTVARGMLDSGRGQVVLIDPQERVIDTERHAEQWFDLFDVRRGIRYLNVPVDAALPVVRDLVAGKEARLVVIDRVHERDDELRAFAGYFAMLDRGAALLRPKTGDGWTLLPLDGRDATRRSADPRQGLILGDRGAGGDGSLLQASS